MRTGLQASLFSLVLTGSASALTPGPDDVYVRVVDVGPGLCTITEVPGEFYMVYDVGHWTGSTCIEAAREIIDGEQIDLLVISHADSDHHGEAKELLTEFQVLNIWRTGEQRWGTGTWRETNDAIAEEVKYGASVRNLQSTVIGFGDQFGLGDATVTFVVGWPEWTDSGPTASEKRNAISIVVRLDYKGHSVLFTGDTVGRRKSDNNNACKDAEKKMVDNASNVPLKADVMIAPHHGGNNGSARCFIQAVDPEFVVFPAGHKHQHPTSGAAGRYVAHGVSTSKIFRTDRGDDESGSFEWKVGSINGCNDGRGDDDVDIVLPETGQVQVAYRRPSTGC